MECKPPENQWQPENYGEKMLVYQIPFSDLMPDDLKMCHPGRAKKRKIHRNRFQFAQKLTFLEYLVIANG